ncbi:MAG: uracil-DNA glycosylase [Ardenticatenaceae bacterium]|nr:uracil-DNA glycosylase [Ardenticatenaceae bacterium]
MSQIHLMIDRFVDKLTTSELSSKDYVNFYGESSLRKNLSGYLSIMQTQSPSLLLVGEAPGYLGGRLTGIPFTSPRIVKTHPYFARRSRRFLIDSNQSEQSATIVWETFATLDVVPLCWNAFPFHPHLPGNTQSNRPPKADELAFGRPFIYDLIQIFQPRTIAAVGRKAEKQLQQLDLPHTYIRHPSRGGKKAFVNGLRKLLIATC